MLPPSGSTAPPLYTGVSWMNRAATRFGDMITARASLGTLRSSDTDMVILTSEGRGSIVSIWPTGTPRTRT